MSTIPAPTLTRTRPIGFVTEPPAAAASRLRRIGRVVDLVDRLGHTFHGGADAVLDLLEYRVERLVREDGEDEVPIRDLM